MKKQIWSLIGAFFLVVYGSSAYANEVEGPIEAINFADSSIVVQGINLYVTPTTEYEDGVDEFSDLVVGQNVEVDFIYSDGRHYAEEIELEE